jgi:hypothetical protein
MTSSTSRIARGHLLSALALGIGIASCGVKVHPYPPLEGTDPGGSLPPAAGEPPPIRGPAAPPTTGGAGSGVASPSGAGGSGGSAGSAGNAGAPGGAGAAGSTGSGGAGVPGAAADARPGTADAAPPAATEGITIGGRFVPRDKAVVFIHVGHSDMAGRATGPAELRPFMFETHPQLWVYQKGGSFRPAREPTCGDEDSAGKSGPGMALLRTGLMRAPDAHMISIGHGHSGSTIGFCPNFRRGKPLYATFMDAARELRGKVTFAGLFTMFGITEYHTGMQGLATTGDCILGLINEVRADLGVPDLPLMVGDWNQEGSGIYSPTGEYGRIVKPQLARLPDRDPRTGLIPTADLGMQDDRHLNMAGQKLWAERALMIMAERSFLAPWGK